MATATTSMGNDSGRDRDDYGRFSESVTLEELAAYLHEHQGASTGELAGAFDVSTETVRRKCIRLEEQGKARAREAGPTTFWQPGE